LPSDFDGVLCDGMAEYFAVDVPVDGEGTPA
jgi:hypothetical protein